MAKVTAPLLSLGASGQIGKAVVHFPWKGINAVRSYVIPANPRTAGQNAQRTKLTNAVALIHECMQYASHPLNGADKIAYSLWGSTYATPRTWYNQITKHLIEQSIKDLASCIFTDGGTTPGVNQLAIALWQVGGHMAGGRIYYGTTKACTSGYITADIAAGAITATIPNLTKGIKYYWHFLGTAPASGVGTHSGVYYGVPT